jgi:glycerol-3-phosphate dehydrogenase
VGMVDGFGLGTNTKSVIMREGLYEMRKWVMFIKIGFNEVIGLWKHFCYK